MEELYVFVGIVGVVFCVAIVEQDIANRKTRKYFEGLNDQWRNDSAKWKRAFDAGEDVGPPPPPPPGCI